MILHNARGTLSSLINVPAARNSAHRAYLNHPETLPFSPPRKNFREVSLARHTVPTHAHSTTSLKIVIAVNPNIL